jgi:hypothetical protein
MLHVVFLEKETIYISGGSSDMASTLRFKSSLFYKNKGNEPPVSGFQFQ